MQVKTSDLSGVALDFAVAKAEWGNFFTETSDITKIAIRQKYSRDWSTGGVIIERDGIFVMAPIVRRIGIEQHALTVDYWRAMIRKDENELAIHGAGPTPLVAAMRCYVSSKLGETVDIPDSLN